MRNQRMTIGLVMALGGLLTLSSPVSAEQTLDSIYNQSTELGDQRVQGDPDEKALRNYQQYLEQNPGEADSSKALHRLGDLHLRLGLKIMDTSDDRQSLERGREMLERSVSHYRNLLGRDGHYPASADVLYQMARAYENLGEPAKATSVLKTLVARHPNSSRYDEIQFRLGETYFSAGNYTKALEAYDEVIRYGESSDLYPQALFKAGWSSFKLGDYRESLKPLFTLLDLSTRRGLKGELVGDESRTDEALRIVALNFYYMGGPRTIAPYLERNIGPRDYEDLIYERMAEQYLEKDLTVEAVAAYRAYLVRNPYKRDALDKQKLIIDLYADEGMTDKVLEEKARLATDFAPGSEFWTYFKGVDLPDVRAAVEYTQRELAEHYNAEWSSNNSQSDFDRAEKWYQAYLGIHEKGSTVYRMSFQYADMLYAAEDYTRAARQYEVTAYEYPSHKRSAEAGYAALQAHEKHIDTMTDEDRIQVAQLASVNGYLRFVYAFPQHPKAAEIITVAAERVYEAENYDQAAKLAELYIERFPNAPARERRSIWRLMASASFKEKQYARAERGFENVLELTDPADEEYAEVRDQLAAVIYQQGEDAREEENYTEAARAFARVREKVPGSDLVVNADYDAATAYINAESPTKAIDLLEGLRSDNPDNRFKDDIVRKLAVLYDQTDQPVKAAEEFIVIGRTDEDPDRRRKATLKAAKLYEDAGQQDQSLAVYRDFIERFPSPAEDVVEVMNDISIVYKEQDNLREHYRMLSEIVVADARAGAERTDRTTFLAAQASLGLAEPRLEAYEKIRLVQPLQENMARKQKLFDKTISAYERASAYGVAEVTTESTYRIGQIYQDFVDSLMESERPGGMSEMEIEQYDILLEEQAYPFEEEAIAVYEANVKRLHKTGYYDRWVNQSIQALGQLMPFEYDRQEKREPYITIAEEGEDSNE
ncbi:MAG: tetratricopeptide repeat protein [Pseudomonadota bacterium]